MSLLSLIALSLDALATGMSLVLLYRQRDWRLGGLSLLLGLITLSHVLVYAGGEDQGVPPAVAVTGLFVSVLAVLLVVLLQPVLRERQQAVAALHRPDDAFRRTFEGALEGVFRTGQEVRTLAYALRSISESVIITDLDGTITFVNDAFLATYGYAWHEVIGHSIHLLRSPRTVDPSPGDQLKNSPEGLWQGEVFSRRKDGTEILVLLSLSYLLDEHGQRIGLIGVERDISQLRYAEQALHRSETKNRALLRAIPDAIFQLSEDGVFIDFVPAEGFELLQPPSEFLGRSVDVIKSEGVVREIRKGIKQALQEGEPYRFQYELTMHGEARFYEARLVPCGNASVLAIVRDVTEATRTEIALRESEEQYRSLINQSPYPVYVYSEDRYVLVNDAWEQLFGYTFAEATAPGFSFSKILAPENLPLIQERHALRVRGAPVPSTYTVTGVHRNGDTREIEVSTRDITWGGHPAVQGICWDVTEHRRFERSLILARDRAEEMSRLKSTFLTNMSHEIRTPLTAILGFASVLAEEVPREQREMAQLIERSGKRLLHTLNSVLDLSMLEAGSLQLQFERFGVRAEIREKVQLLQPLAREKGLHLHVAAADEVTVYLDRACFGRILDNLIGNAIKFTSAGEVRIEAKARDDGVAVRVVDTGRGIGAAFLPYLFDEFAQESSGMTRSHEGSGLGLAITKRLVDLMGGTIRVESTVGEGTAFILSFSRSDSDARLPGDGEGLQRHEQEQRAGTAPRDLRILVVEDNPETRMLVKHLLRNHYQAHVVNTLEEALQVAKSRRFIVIDHHARHAPDAGGRPASPAF